MSTSPMVQKLAEYKEKYFPQYQAAALDRLSAEDPVVVEEPLVTEEEQDAEEEVEIEEEDEEDGNS